MQINFTLNTVIIIVTVLVSLIAFSNPAILSKLMFNPYSVKHRNEWYRAFTHAFVHANLLHLFLNMYVLYSFGNMVESIFTNGFYFRELFPDIPFWGASKGYLYYFVLYLGGILFATIPGFRKHQDNPAYNSLGASGAVSAVVIALIIMLPTTSIGIIFLPFRFPAFVFAIAYLVYEFYMNKRGGTGIAHDAHIYGAIYGMVYMVALNFGFVSHFVDSVAVYFQQIF